MLHLAPRRVNARRAGDAWYLESPIALREHADTLGELFQRAAAKAPSRDFLIERRDGELRRTTYGQAYIDAAVINAFVAGGGPVMALSGNSINHALLMVGCFMAGVPFVPVSPAYSLVSQDFAKLRAVAERVKPAIVYVESRAPFERALAAIQPKTIIDGAMLERGLRIVGDAQMRPSGDDVAKILFTSGSTGFPKGVPNTHRMLCANQQMIAQLWPFLEEDPPPVLVDWLPWSHTFGGNHNFNMVLAHGGTLLVDEGKPAPPLIGVSLKNLMEVPPTLYFNVPAGYAALVPHLERDDALRKAFFSRLQVMFYAAAALPPDLWTRLVALAKKTTERDVFMTTAWGSTETSPLATSAHFPLESAGNIGLPAPGVTLKLVPNGRKLEVRVKGPSVMSGYLDEPELTKQAFDEEGFYKIGDAVRFVDDNDPSKGLAFDGRVAEDFKLSSGTWVSVTNVRTGVVAQCGGLVTDVVVCGQDKDAIAILAWPLPTTTRDAVLEALRAWNAKNGASSMRVSRCILLAEPPSIDAGEITDKGYVNQRATIERRAADVARLYADRPDEGVLCV
jgi:feruloyl-CoA synthase